MDAKSFTQILIDSRHQEGRVAELFELAYDELGKMARRQLRAVQAPHTLNTAELINEAFMRMVDHDQASWEDRAHFCAYAARTITRSPRLTIWGSVPLRTFGTDRRNDVAILEQRAP